MTIPVLNPVSQTYWLIALLAIVLCYRLRHKQEPLKLSTHVTSELKGFAILAVIFAHICFYLSQDSRFLNPVALSAGVGVDLFLFLSGYGLTHSMIHKDLGVLAFYKRRLIRIFVPLWTVLIMLFGLDFLILDRTYSPLTILESFLGFFPRADLYESLNAPFWYLTLILFYYLIYPILFSKKAPFITSLLIGATGLIVSRLTLPVNMYTLVSYKVHVLAFPLGVTIASLVYSQTPRIKKIVHAISAAVNRPGMATFSVRLIIISVLIALFAYTTIHARIGEGVWLQQLTGLFTMLTVVAIFVLKPIEIPFLSLIGMYSYEIYLIHWPLLYRYDVLYRFLPASLATFLYLFVFLAIGYALQKLSNKILDPSKTKQAPPSLS